MNGGFSFIILWVCIVCTGLAVMCNIPRGPNESKHFCREMLCLVLAFWWLSVYLFVWFVSLVAVSTMDSAANNIIRTRMMFWFFFIASSIYLHVEYHYCIYIYIYVALWFSCVGVCTRERECIFGVRTADCLHGLTVCLTSVPLLRLQGWQNKKTKTKKV